MKPRRTRSRDYNGARRRRQDEPALTARSGPVYRVTKWLFRLRAQAASRDRACRCNGRAFRRKRDGRPRPPLLLGSVPRLRGGLRDAMPIAAAAAETTGAPPMLDMRGIGKAFHGVTALIH